MAPLEPLQQMILHTLRALPGADAQNRLMRTPDMELALSMIYMAPEQHQEIFRRTGPAKTARLTQLLERHRHTRITREQYVAASREVLRRLGGETGGTGSPLSSYYRPNRTR